MMVIYYLLFSAVGIYAVLGNLIAYTMLASHGVPVRFIFAGVPGYVYRASVEAGLGVSTNLRRFCFSTSVAFLITLLLGLGLVGLSG